MTQANHATLGLAHKGVRAYEAFALSRHHMNRTVYYHAKVAVLELMLEKCLVEMAEVIAKQDQPVDGLPASLCRLLSAGQVSGVDQFIERHIDSYLDITEDHVWTALSFVSCHWTGRARDLAQGVLERKLLPYFHVQQGKSAEIASALDSAGFGPRDYCVRRKKSNVYGDGASDDDAVVHVVGDDGQSEAVTSHSFILKAFANKPEIETLLVVLDLGKTQPILEAARRCLSRRRTSETPEAVLKQSSRNGAGESAEDRHLQGDDHSVF